jgi:hypothetical protein
MTFSIFCGVRRPPLAAIWPNKNPTRNPPALVWGVTGGSGRETATIQEPLR